MKNILTIIFLAFNTLVFSQLTVTTTMTPEQLVQNVLAGSGVTISNVTFNGQPGNIATTQCGFFNGVNSNVGIGSGMIIGSGDVNVAEGPNGQGGATLGSSDVIVADNDLNNIATTDLNDHGVLEFDFVPIGDTISFKYVFGSEEYNEYVCSDFNDVFGFFISGPGINGAFSNNGENIAIIPGTTTPVAINTINNGSAGDFGDETTCDAIDPNWQAYSIFYNNNSQQSVQYDGMTVVLTAFSPVTCGETYHIKIAIADAFDASFDSGVFLEAGSLTSTGLNIDLSTVTGDTIIYENCTSADFVFTRPQSMIDETTVVNYVLSGTATEGVDYTNLADNVTFNPGEDTILLNLSAFQDGVLEGNETVIVTATYTSECGDVITIEKTLTITEEPIFDAIVNAPEVFCPSDTVDMIVQAIGGTPPYIYTWDINGTPTIGDTVHGAINGLGTETYTVDIVDFCGFTFQSSVTITQSPPPTMDLDLFANLVGCNDLTVDMFAFEIGGVAPIEITWNNGQVGNFVTGATDVQTYTVTATDACNNVYSEDLVLEFEELIPIVVTATAPLATCVDQSVLATAISNGGNFPLSYSWDNGAQGASVQLLVAGLPTYTVTVTDNCGQTETASVTIALAPDPTLTINAPDVNIQCPDPTVDLTALASGGFQPYTYTWDGNLGTGATVTASALTNGTQTFNVTATDVCGNTSTESVNLILNQTLDISNTSQTVSVNCAPTGTSDVTVIGATGTVNYQWNGPGITGPIVSNLQTAQNLATGWYFVTATDAVCLTVDSVFVQQLDPVSASFAASETIGDLPLAVTFTNSSQNADSFDWDFGNGQTQLGTDISNQSTSYNATNTFTVELIARQGVCTDTAFLQITILSEPSLFPPNIFTPNGDNANDVFTLNHSNFKSFSYIILNRWGNVMFEGDLINPTWNGLLSNGNEASEGTYFYEYAGVGLNNKELEGQGFFQLVRK
jgi:gliding motility-associated-like protein